VSGTSAVGVLSGAAGPESGSCEDWDPDVNFSFGYALTGSAHSADEFYQDGEWELAVAVSAPVLQVSVDLDDLLVVSGVVDRGGPNHWVSVALGGRTYVGSVGPGGHFSVRIDDDLVPAAMHLVIARAHFGRYSQSEAVFETVTIGSHRE
jgi:hypothetical protein